MDGIRLVMIHESQPHKFRATTGNLFPTFVTVQLSNLESIWQELFLPFQVEPTLRKKLFLELVAAYSRSDRYYHNLIHIQHILSIASMLESFAENFPAIKMAAWFHDAIYDSQANNNEEKSAEYADDSLKKINIPTATINLVVRMILNTKNHATTLDDIDSQILLDADLSILASETSEYKTYAQAIRLEYSWVADAEYRIGRKRVLQSFLQRDRIYFTDQAFQMLELKARKNIKAELSNL